MRTLNRVTRGFAAIAVLAATVLLTAPPTDAGKPVHNNITQVAAYGYDSGSGDRMNVTALFDTALKGRSTQSAGMIEFTVTWRDSLGTTIQTDTPSFGIYPRQVESYTQFSRPDGAVEVQVSITLSKQIRTGLEVLDTFESGTWGCSGEWTSTPTPLFNLSDID